MNKDIIDEKCYFENVSFCPNSHINPLNAELNPICRSLAILGPHTILHVSSIKVNTNYIQCQDFKNFASPICMLSLEISLKFTKMYINI